MVSVIIPTYNRAETLEKAVQSVLNQTYSDIELLIVDDCSTDNTSEIINKMADPRITYINLNINQGACVARNTGIENAHGEYIAFQDSDDSWQTNKLELQLKALKEYRADISFCELHRHSTQNNKQEFYPDLKTGIINYNQVLSKSIVSTQTIVAKRNVFDNYKFDPQVKRMQDYDWIIRAGEKYRIVFVREAIVDTYIQPDSISNMGYESLALTNEYFLEKYSELLEKYPDFYISLLERIGHSKIMLGEDATKEYQMLYNLKNDTKSWLKWICAKNGILKYLWRHKA